MKTLDFMWENFYFLLAITALAAVLGVGGCADDGSISNLPPHIVENCEPKPIADAGGDQWIVLKPDMADFVFIGTPAIPGTQYEWAPSEGVHAPKSAVTIATPDKKTVYTLTAKNKCGVAKSSVTVHVLKETKLSPKSFSILSKDKFGVEQEYQTGYEPSELEHYRAQYLHMPAEGYTGIGRMADGEELDLTPPDFHVNRQPNGSCWAEGARSAAEAGLFRILGVRRHVSTQRIIDCSGFGSAKWGGQISVDDFLPPYGIVDNADYPYSGNDQKCDKSPAFRERAEKTYIVRSADGSKPKNDDIKNALKAFAMMEVCGSAGALGNGGWDDEPDNGAVNHCWAHFGIKLGELHGFPAGDYHNFQNSWGDKWGGGKGLHPGQVAIRIAPNGVDIKGSVLVENKVAVFGSPCPPPVADGGPDKTILQIPGTPQAVRIGVPGKPDQTYSWTPSDSLDDASLAEPIASPSKTTVYTVETKNKCATVSSKVTVRVYADTRNGPVELK